MGQFDKNSSVISLVRSLINLNQGSFTLKMMNFSFTFTKMMNFMKMRTFYKKLPLFIKNSILHIYKKTQTSNMSFYKKLNFWK